MGMLPEEIRRSNQRHAIKLAEIRAKGTPKAPTGSKWEYEFQTKDGIKTPVGRFRDNEYQPYTEGVSDETIHEEMMGDTMKKGIPGFRKDVPIYKKGTPEYQERFDEIRAQRGPAQGSFTKGQAQQMTGGGSKQIPQVKAHWWGYSGLDNTGREYQAESRNELIDKLERINIWNTPEKRARRAEKEAQPYFKSSTGDIRGYQAEKGSNSISIFEGPGSATEYKKHMGWDTEDDKSLKKPIDDFISSAVSDSDTPPKKVTVGGSVREYLDGFDPNARIQAQRRLASGAKRDQINPTTGRFKEGISEDETEGVMP